MKKHAVIIRLVYMFAASLLLFSFAHGAVPKKLEAFPEGERLVYTRLLEAFRRGQMGDVASQRQLLERNYPASNHLDNAYYLSGMLEFQNGRYGEALKTFNVIRTRFPKSNKRPAALFATAMTYERLNLKPQAQRVLATLIQDYPGSPEAQRAWMQLKVEKQKPRAAVKR